MKFYTLMADGLTLAALLDSRVKLIQSRAEEESDAEIFAVHFDHHPDYLQSASPISLLALIYLLPTDESVSIWASILSASPEHIHKLENAIEDLAWLQAYVATHHAPWLNLSGPLLLDPVYIPKPWGQEIWYTGIEARGQSRVSDGCFSVPLPWVLELLPQQEPLTLLKILDPLADENFGNLYFELHEQKQEVYIVTHVDSQAWPEGVGQIQMGFCQKKRNEYASAAEFKEAYLAAVNNYRSLRKIIDEFLDQLQLESHIDRISLYQEFFASDKNKTLVHREQVLRQAMNAFIYHHPLRVGDVIKVPCYTPHSLQHGVRVVEFQTPVYERKILSFGQKVLTQDDWDTEEAIAIAHVDAANLDKPELLASSTGYRLERIVNFDDFQVQRLETMAPLETLLKQEANMLVMLIKGKAAFVDSTTQAASSRALFPTEAYLVPQACKPGANGQRLVVEKDSILLVAMPNDSSWSDLH